MPFLVCIGPYCQPACRTYALLGKPGETALHLPRVATVGNVLISDPLLIIRPLFPQVQCRISQLDMVFVKQSQRQQDRIRSPVLQRLLQMFEQAFAGDRKSTRLNSSHVSSSYAVFCLKKTKSIT